MNAFDEVAWPIDRLGEAASELAYHAGLERNDVFVPPPSRATTAGGVLSVEPWIESVVEWLGIDSESVETTYAELSESLEASGPALWVIPDERGEASRCVAIVRGSKGRLRVLLPSGGTTRVPTELVRRAVGAPVERHAHDQIEAVLALADIDPRRRERTREALLTERFGQLRIDGAWILRPAPGSSFWAQARHARVHRLAARLVIAHGLNYVLMLASWWTLGRGALSGHFDPAWLIAWALLLISAIPFRLLSSWSQSLMSLRLGRLLKQRLLAGTFRLDSTLVRNEGSGDLLGRVIESEAVESLMTTGGFTAVTASVELLIVGWLLAQGPSGGLHFSLFAMWIGLTFALAFQYYRRRREWTDERLGLSKELVERMLAHRTRLAQQAPERWHEGEDVAVDRYLQSSKRADHAAIRISTLMGRGWVIVGLLGLVPAFIAANTSAESLAIGLGATMLADRALQKMTLGLRVLCDAMISWRAVAPIFHAAARSDAAGVPGATANASRERSERQSSNRAPLVEASGLTFRHAGRANAVIEDCDLAIYPNDRILLESPSGGGKSSLAALLTALRPADAGLLLLRGFDRRTLGATAWRRGVVSAPQFHENHVFSGSFAFNVLMGRTWPAPTALVEEAEHVCRELGLGPLLERMPGGMLQTVGESGWQLSHGERSRLFIARALMQRADLVILDESFAALDPENLDLALECVRRRTNALMVIAHP